jgi:hypothetical protein
MGAAGGVSAPVAGADPLRVLALDPQAPGVVRDLVAADGPGPGRLAERHGGGVGSLRLAGLRLALAVFLVAAMPVLDRIVATAPSGRDVVGRLVHQVLEVARWTAWGSVALLAAAAVTTTLAAVAAWRQDAAAQQAVARARSYVVLEGEVDPNAVRLLARAQAAAATVLGSALHAEDLLDRQRGNMVVPAEVWAIATALRDRVRIAARAPGPVQDRARGEHRAQQLAQADAAVRSRIEALEEYARAVRRAEAGYWHWQQAQEPSEVPRAQPDEEAVLGLLTASAGQEAARVLKAMTSRAEELAEVLDPGSGNGPTA